MPDLFEEYDALELDKLIQRSRQEAPQKPEAGSQAPEQTETKRKGTSLRARILWAAAAAAVLIGAIFGFIKYRETSQSPSETQSPEAADISLCRTALEAFRQRSSYYVVEDRNGTQILYVHAGTRSLCIDPTSAFSYYKLWVDGTEYAGNIAGSWSFSSAAADTATVPWLWDYEWGGSDRITHLKTEETAGGKAITLLFKSDGYWRSSDSSYIACFTLNSRNELEQIRLTRTVPDSEYTQTFTVEEASEAELSAWLNEVFIEAYLLSNTEKAPLRQCLRAIYQLAKQDAFHIQYQASSSTVGTSTADAYWDGSWGAAQWCAPVDNVLTPYCQTLYEAGYITSLQLGGIVSRREDPYGLSTADSVLADFLPQYDWTSSDLTLLDTDHVGTGINYLFLIDNEDAALRTTVCFCLDNGYNLVSITESSADWTFTYRVLNTDEAQINAAINKIAINFYESSGPDE